MNVNAAHKCQRVPHPFRLHRKGWEVNSPQATFKRGIRCAARSCSFTLFLFCLSVLTITPNPATRHRLALPPSSTHQRRIPHLRRLSLETRHPATRLGHRRPGRRERPKPRRRRLLPHRHRLVSPQPYPHETRPHQTHVHRLRRHHGQLRRLLQWRTSATTSTGTSVQTTTSPRTSTPAEPSSPSASTTHNNPPPAGIPAQESTARFVSSRQAPSTSPHGEALSQRPKVAAESATIHVRVTVTNDSHKSASISIAPELTSPAGAHLTAEQTFHSKPTTIPPHESADLDVETNLSHPDRWDLEHGALYTLNARLLENNKPIDNEQVSFGIREFHFDPTRASSSTESTIKSTA